MAEASAGTAYFNTRPDSDSVVRNSLLVLACGDVLYPALALEAVRQNLGVRQIVIEYNRDGVLALRLGERVIPTDAEGLLPINYRQLLAGEGAGTRFAFTPHYSAVDLLSGKIGRAELEEKIVFVGSSAAGLRDLRAIPLTSEFSGIEIQATLADNLLAGDFLLKPWFMKNIEIAVILFTGLFLSFLIHRGRSLFSFLISMLVIIASLIASVVLFTAENVLFLPVWPVLCAGIVYTGLTVIRYRQREQEVGWVKQVFGDMVSPVLLKRLEENPLRYWPSAGRKRT